MGQYTFIDLFAGVGGFRIAFDRAGAKCVFTSEFDRHAARTYEANHGDKPHGDITKITNEEIPPHDILVGGFPCQAFSMAGIGTRNALGRPFHGFEDKTRGTLFFEIARILKHHRPKAFVLENVKNLLHHDGGRTFGTIWATLTQELGYTVEYKVYDAARVVPQRRRRVFIVGFREPIRFEWPIIPDLKPKLRDILEEDPPAKCTLRDSMWTWLQRHKAKHHARGNKGLGFKMANLDGIASTLSARYGFDGAEILIPQEGKNPRMLSVLEAARLMGFPEDFKFPCHHFQSYKQMGNSVVVPVVEPIAKAVVAALDRHEIRDEHPFLEGYV